MTARSTFLSVLLLAALASIVLGQVSRAPDLSGTWKLNLQKSKLLKGSTLGDESLVIKQDGQRLEFDYNSNGKSSAEVYVTDKKDKVIREIPAAGSRIVAKAYWKSAALVTETRIDFKMSSPVGAYEMMHTKDSWALSDDGLTLTDKSSSDRGESLLVFEKQK
jgi:hypothetical protein